MIMDFILFLLTVHGKKIAKSGYSAHSSMRDSNIISPEGTGKVSLSAVISSKSPGTAQSGRFHCSIQAKPLLNFAGRGDFLSGVCTVSVFELHVPANFCSTVLLSALPLSAHSRKKPSHKRTFYHNPPRIRQNVQAFESV